MKLGVSIFHGAQHFKKIIFIIGAKKKLEVLVARSIFASENVKTGSGVFWKGCDVEKLQATVAQSTFINKNEK